MRTKISDFTLFMAALGTLAAFRWIRAGSLPETGLSAAFFLLLYTAGQNDLRTGRLPDWCALTAFFLGALSLLFCSESVLYTRLAGIFAVSLPLFLICLLKPGAFGGGDIKLMAGCGFFLGAETVWFSFLIAVFSGGGWALFLLLTGRADRKTRFPFGPFLCAGMALALVFKFP